MQEATHTSIPKPFIVTAIALVIAATWFFFNRKETITLPEVFESETTAPAKPKFVPFTSSEDFQSYMSQASKINDLSAMNSQLEVSREMSADMLAGTNDAISAQSAPGKPVQFNSADRVSSTNVQVIGIDEPDIVKTNGKELFFAHQNQRFIQDPLPIEIQGTNILQKRDFVNPKRPVFSTDIINAFPPTELSRKAVIEESGNLLLDENTLLVFNNRENPKKISGYDVSNPSQPTKNYEIEIDKNHQILTSRLLGDTLYLITRSSINYNEPCPVKITEDHSNFTILCSDIYHPVEPTATDSTFNFFTLDPQTGEVKNASAFVGSRNNSVIYMSPKALYLTYSTRANMAQLLLNFYNQDAQELFSQQAINRLSTLRTYDLSQRALNAELDVIINQELQTKNKDERKKFSNELNNKREKFFEDNLRILESTGIVSLDLDSLEVQATGSVPGKALNQFSLDEYQGTLRIATTIGEGVPWVSRELTLSDLYTLDEKLEILGKVENMGRGERIYSARFVGDQGYIVTFRQIDPFYVIDLSQPTDPRITGELKIPGFSSYLDPLADNLILGIGQEDRQVKLSLFDVSDPTNPTEISKYLLDENWSEIANNHHAFLKDEKFKAFFLPAGGSGYVFSYENNELTLKTTVADVQAKRAIYLNDFLYIIGEEKITVLSEEGWGRVGELRL